MSMYVNAIGDEERKALAAVRQNRSTPSGPDCRFLWLGRWTAHKGIDCLVEFIRQRIVENSADTFTIAGCGDEAVRHIGLELLNSGRIKVVPSYDRRELTGLMRTHDAGLFTSIVEGWGLTLQEMLESGMLVYATDTGAARDLRDEFPGLLMDFPPPPSARGNFHRGTAIKNTYFDRFSWTAIAVSYIAMIRGSRQNGNEGYMQSANSASERMRLRLFRAYAWVWRFRSLALAETVFRNYDSSCIVTRRFFGYNLYLDVSRSNAQRQLYLVGERFVSEAVLVNSLLKPGATVVDVGANIGYYVLLAANRVGQSGRIIAFEPEPDNLVELRMNVECNGLSNVEIRPFAVGAETGQIVFATGVNGRVCSGMAASDTVRVPIVTLDTTLTDTIDMIKIDVEGYEGEVLAGAESTIKQCRPNLFVEIHPTLMYEKYTVDGILEFLQSYYSDIKFYQPAVRQTMTQKLGRYVGRPNIEEHTREAVLAACRDGTQPTFWAICRSQSQ